MSIAVRVRLFASLREAAGFGDSEVVLADSGTTPDINALTGELAARLDDGATALLQGSSVRIAVNQTFIEGNVPLADGDEVAFLPPVTGG